MRVLNSILRDYLEREVINVQTEYISLPDNCDISPEIRADLNSRIHLRNLEGIEIGIEPGNLYTIKYYTQLQEYVEFLPRTLKEFRGEFFDNIPDRLTDNIDLKTALNRCKIVMLEVTPPCDFTFGKWRASRVLIGITYPQNELLINRYKKKADYLCKTPMFSIENEVCKFVFNYHYLISIPFSVLEILKPRYQIRLDLLSDIQDRFSNHLSRKGIIEL